MSTSRPIKKEEKCKTAKWLKNKKIDKMSLKCKTMVQPKKRSKQLRLKRLKCSKSCPSHSLHRYLRMVITSMP